MALSTVDEIRSSRDAALAATSDALFAISQEIATTTTTGLFLDRLTKRHQDLINERAAIREAATDLVLALPEVIAAAQTLNDVATEMLAEAGALPSATNILTSTAKILTLGQNFVDTIASARRT
jgi:hypothetical protein